MCLVFTNRSKHGWWDVFQCTMQQWLACYWRISISCDNLDKFSTLCHIILFELVFNTMNILPNIGIVIIRTRHPYHIRHLFFIKGMSIQAQLCLYTESHTLPINTTQWSSNSAYNYLKHQAQNLQNTQLNLASMALLYSLQLIPNLPRGNYFWSGPLLQCLACQI